MLAIEDAAGSPAVGRRAFLKFGKDARNQHFAREIVDTQRREIGEIRDWLKQKNIPQP